MAVIGNQAFSLLNLRGALIRAMVERAATVLALAPDFDAASREAIRSLGAEPVDFSMDRVGIRPINDLKDLVKLAKLLRTLDLDVTLSYFAKPVIYGTVAARVARVPRRFSLVAGLGYMFADGGSRFALRHKMLRRVVLRLYRVAFSLSDQVFFQNEDDIAFFAERHVICAGKATRIWGTGVDLEYYRLKPAVTAPVTFLLAARLLSQKGIREYVDAARSLKERYPQVRVLLAGGLDANPDGLVEDEVRAWVREGVLEWLGHVPDIRPWLEQASVYVLPSYYREGVPRSTQEAMAMGRPVVTTACVGCRETVIHGANGYLVPPRDSRALAEAMERFLQEPSLVESMGRRSRLLAEERFDVKKINGVILDAMGL